MTTRSGKRLARPPSPAAARSSKASKRARLNEGPHADPEPKSTSKLASADQPIDLDGDEDFEVLLERIREQEASEALARKLQDQEDGLELVDGPAAGSSHANGMGSGSKFGTPNGGESDEAMARRLAEAWDQEDQAAEEEEEEEAEYGDSFTEEYDDYDEFFHDLPPPPPAVLSPSPCPATVLSPSPDPAPARQSPKPQSPDVERSSKTSPEEEDLAQHRDIFTTCSQCSKCQKTLYPPRSPVFFYGGTPPPSLLQQLHVYCPVCKVNHCRGCGQAVDCAKTCKASKTGSCPVQKCCSRIRAIAIFEILGAFDPLYVNDCNTSSKRSSTKNNQPRVQTVGPGGTGYSTGSNYHPYPPPHPPRGRGRRATTAIPFFAETPSRSVEAWDETVTSTINTLLEFLPNPYSEEPSVFDLLPHPSIRSLVVLSHLPELLSNLLRNDSVMDWTMRSDVYNATLTLLRRLSDSELTIDLLIRPRLTKVKSCGLAPWIWEEGDIDWEMCKSADEDTFDYAPPLYDHFKKLTKQCEMFLSGASQMMEDGANQSADDQEVLVKAMSLCGDILAARDDIERAISALKAHATPDGAGKGKSVDTSISLEKKYAAECERLAFKHVTMSHENENGAGLVYDRYNFAQTLNQTSSSTRNPKNRLHLVKELAVMATCLPPGVWVRVDEVRNDAIKIMIAGPENTPYEGGLFEFDCFIPLEYPHKPPLMHLRTTGGGTVRFNPNLYNNGKVCLSLLGTWPGRPEEQWSPKSTILQVLVSIQSMILIDAPYFNEPGYGQANLKDSRSIAYNRNIALQTTRWAIVEWMKEDNRNGIWAEVIKSHFLTRKDVIKKRLQQWAKTDGSFKKYVNGRSGHDEWGLGGLAMPSSYPGSFAAAYMPMPQHFTPPQSGSSSKPSPYPSFSLHNLMSTPGAIKSAHKLAVHHMASAPFAQLPQTVPVNGGDFGVFNAGLPAPVTPQQHGYMFAGQPGGSSGHPYRNGKPANGEEPKGMNLLKEFDEGIKLISEWEIEE